VDRVGAVEGGRVLFTSDVHRQNSIDAHTLDFAAHATVVEVHFGRSMAGINELRIALIAMTTDLGLADALDIAARFVQRAPHLVICLRIEAGGDARTNCPNFGCGYEVFRLLLGAGSFVRANGDRHGEAVRRQPLRLRRHGGFRDHDKGRDVEEPPYLRISFVDSSAPRDLRCGAAEVQSEALEGARGFDVLRDACSIQRSPEQKGQTKQATPFVACLVGPRSWAVLRKPRWPVAVHRVLPAVSLLGRWRPRKIETGER